MDSKPFSSCGTTYTFVESWGSRLAASDAAGGAASQTLYPSCGSSLQLDNPLSMCLGLGRPRGTHSPLPGGGCSPEERRPQSCPTGNALVPGQAQAICVCWSVWLVRLASAFVVELWRIPLRQGWGTPWYLLSFPLNQPLQCGLLVSWLRELGVWGSLQTQLDKIKGWKMNPE